MPTPLSLSPVVLGTTPSVWRMWRPADAAARWVSALGAVLPWLVLAQWGVQLTYSWAGGMLPLALWWAGRLCLAPWSHVLDGRWSSLLGAALAGAGMWVLAQDAHGHLHLLAWAGVVLGWLVFSESLRGLRTSPSEGGGFAHVALPVTAALIWLLAGDPLAWQSHWLWHIVVLLALGAAAFLLAPQAQRVASSPPVLPALPPDGATLSSRSLMGLMMGGLFVFDQSCLGPAWPPATVIGLHLGVMTVLSGLAMALRATSLHAEPMGALLRPWRLPLMLAGSMLLLAASGPPWTLLGMVLQVLPWVIDMQWRAVRGAGLAETGHPASSWHWAGSMSLLTGPVLLLAMGTYASSQGPALLASLQLGVVLVGVLTLRRQDIRVG